MTGGKLPGEFELIAQYLAPLAKAMPGAAGLTDDAAVLDATSDRGLVVTADTLVAGVHFVAEAPSELIAEKLLRVNLSDLAAMAASPWAYTLSLALPESTDRQWMASFVQGLASVQSEWGLALVGGDTVRTPGPATLTVSMFGRAGPAGNLTRAGAAAGDLVYVSGTIGDAGLGLAIVKGEIDPGEGADRDYLVERHYKPSPRIDLARAIVAHASAGTDVSDGLIADLGHLCAMAPTPLGARVDAAAVPYSPAARRVSGEPMSAALLTGGDDYELLFTVAPGRAVQVEKICTDRDYPITRIGTMEEVPGVRVFGSAGEIVDLGSGGYRHF